MGALLSIPQRLLNFLLPFTNPNTPLIQDLIHTLILCGTLYFAPQLAELYNAQTQRHPSNPPPTTNEPTVPESSTENLPLEEDLVLQPDEDEIADPLPPAPTPPPGVPGPVDWAPPPAEQADEDDDQGRPAGNDRPRPTVANRTVGAKKAKSLARKDQRRAYHEFHRQEAELRRMREEEGREEREAALAAEKARRAEVEREIQERERQERERKKEEERREQEEERARRERVIDQVRAGLQRRGSVDLQNLAWKEGKDALWIERLVRASGLLAKNEDGSHSMLTGGGWVVRIDEQLMAEAYAQAVNHGNKNGGKVGLEEFGGILEKAVMARANA